MLIKHTYILIGVKELQGEQGKREKMKKKETIIEISLIVVYSERIYIYIFALYFVKLFS